jgi:membrane-associated protein
MVKMEKHVFMFYNIVGSVCWVASMMLEVTFLKADRKYDFSLKDHTRITIGIILVTTLPVLYNIF